MKLSLRQTMFAVASAAGFVAGAGMGVASAATPNGAAGVAVTTVDATTLQFEYQDRSYDELGFDVVSFKATDPAVKTPAATTSYLNGSGQRDRVTVRGLAPNTQYCFQVRSFNYSRDGAGSDVARRSSVWSAPVCGKTGTLPAPAIQPATRSMAQTLLPVASKYSAVPAAPSNLMVVAQSGGFGAPMVLTWSDNATNEHTYELRITNQTTGALLQHKVMGPNASTFLDVLSGQQAGGVRYELRACNDFGCSDQAVVVR